MGVQDEKLFIEIRKSAWSQLGLDMNQVLAQLGQQNAVESGAIPDAAGPGAGARGGQFTAGGGVPACHAHPGASGNQLRLGDIADIKRGYIDPASTKVRHQGQQVVALGVSMSKGGDIIALGKAQGRDRKIPPPCLQGAPGEGAGPAVLAVSKSVGSSSGADRGRGCRAGGELHQSGACTSATGANLAARYYMDLRPGLVVGITIPLVLAVIPGHVVLGHRACTRFRWARSSSRWACWWTTPSLPWR